MKFGVWVRTRDSLSQAKFGKKTLKGLAKLYQKLSILAILGAVSPHFKSDNGEIWHEGAGLELPPSTPNFVKLLKGMYLLWTNLYQKLTIFFDFGVCKPTFLKPQPWSLAWECTPGSPSPRLILLKSLRGICPLWAKFYQKSEIFTIFSYVCPHFYTIMLKFYLRERTFNRNPSTTENFVKIAQEACRYCIASEVMHIHFS